MSFTTSDVLAVLAFLLSLFTTWKTIQFNNRQRSLVEGQEALNKRLLEREDVEAREAKTADIGISVYKVGSSSYRLKVFNKGKSSARGVTLEFPEGNEWLSENDMNSKFPLEVMYPHQSVELIASIHLGSKSKQSIVVKWDDDYRAGNSKTLYPTL